METMPIENWCWSIHQEMFCRACGFNHFFWSVRSLVITAVGNNSCKRFSSNTSGNFSAEVCFRLIQATLKIFYK